MVITALLLTAVVSQNTQFDYSDVCFYYLKYVCILNIITKQTANWFQESAECANNLQSPIDVCLVFLWFHLFKYNLSRKQTVVE